MLPEPATPPIVLAVDDAAETLCLLTDILEAAGMTALIARNGAKALSLLPQVKPDLILMDAVMPKMDGFETCRRIKKARDFAHIPIIFMTGLSDTEHVVKGFESGGVDYVTKPIVPDELLARIRVHLANSRMAQSARIALDISGTRMIAVDSEGKVLWITPDAAKFFGKVHEGFGTEDPQWRDAIAPVLARVFAQRLGRTLLCNTPAGPLYASFIGESRHDEHLIRLSDDSSSGDEDILRKEFDLTAREAEVLLWITQGKSNRDVAAILECSPRTVNKHLEQIFQKLRFENRTAAAMIALRALTKG